MLRELHEYLRQDQLFARSTVAPGTTTYVKKWLERSTDFVIGENLFLAFCPERIAEGKAYEELHSLAQIVGTIDEMSGARAEALFKTLTKTVFRTDFVSAELVKLFNNIARYIHCCSKSFALIADTWTQISTRLGVWRITITHEVRLQCPDLRPNLFTEDFG